LDALKQWKKRQARLWVLCVLLSPFLLSSIIFLFPQILSPITPVVNLINWSVERIIGNSIISRETREFAVVALLVYGLIMGPGLFCLFRLLRKPMDWLLYGFVYLLLMAPLLYLYLLILGLIASGYL